MAIGMHMDGASSGQRSNQAANVETADAHSVSSESSCSTRSDSVRAPIPQKKEVLVEDHYVFGRHGRRRKANSVFDAFRDFQAEARQQMLVANGDSTSGKRKTLEDLFRPPLDLLHKGSFRSACDTGRAANRWLLVNVQNVQEFSCQMLNRDVWSNVSVKELVRKHFVLWQVYSDSEEGRKYMQFYKVDNWPYVAVVDPRTGENLIVWNQLDAVSFCEIVNEFISTRPAPDDSEDDSPPQKKQRSREESIIDASEDSQLRAAIAASMKDVQDKPVCYDLTDSDDADSYHDASSRENDGDGDLETFSDSNSPSAVVLPTSIVDSQNAVVLPTSVTDSQNTADSNLSKNVQRNEEESLTSESTACGKEQTEAVDWKHFLGPSTDPLSRIALRLPDGSRNTLSLPCTSKLQALVSYVSELGYSSERFELLMSFPRRSLSSLDTDSTLRENGLFPQDTIFIQERS